MSARKGRPDAAQAVPNARNKMGGLELLRQVEDCDAAAVVFDPQYRAVLDKLDFGNEGARQKQRALLPQMSDFMISSFAAEIERVLRPAGYLFLWVDKFSIGSGVHLGWLRYAPQLKIVDLIAWNKDRMGMGRRARCQTEYLVCVQKQPLNAASTWKDHSIPDSFSERADRNRHPHAKPLLLMGRVLASTTRQGDLVIDPCAGGYGTLEICQKIGRQFLGCDIADQVG